MFAGKANPLDKLARNPRDQKVRDVGVGAMGAIAIGLVAFWSRTRTAKV